MRKIKDWLYVQLLALAKGFGFIIGLVPAGIWLFVFLELFLLALCRNTRLEIFVLQFPCTLWVLTKKDGK